MRKINARQQKLDEMQAMIGHTIGMLNCWTNELPFSNTATHKTHHAHNLPGQQQNNPLHAPLAALVAEVAEDALGDGCEPDSYREVTLRH